MLVELNAFIRRHSVWAENLFTNPPITQHADLPYPKRARLHYFEPDTGVKFPNRQNYYLENLPKAKKVGIVNINDLSSKEGTTILNNRHLDRDIRVWGMEHRSSFRLLEVKDLADVEDSNTAVINYNLIKDLYSYANNVMAKYNRNYNNLKTLADNFVESLKVDNRSTHILPITIPNNILGYRAMKRLDSFNERKRANIMDETSHYLIYDLFNWLDPDKRHNSVFKEIKDSQADKILLEFKFRGYSTFVTLKMLMSISEDYEFKSNLKLKRGKYFRYLIAFLIRLQEKITLLNNAEIKEERLADDRDKDGYIDPDDNKEPEVTEPDEPESTYDTAPDKVIEEELKRGKREFVKVRPRDQDVISPIDTVISEDDFEFHGVTGGDDLLNKLEELDDYGIELVNRREEEEEKRNKVIEAIAKRPNKAVGGREEKEVTMDKVFEVATEEKSEEEVTKLLKTPTIDEKIDEYIEMGQKHKTLSSSDVKSIRGAQEKRRRLKDPYVGERIDNFAEKGSKVVPMDDTTTKINIKNDLVDEEMKKDVVRNLSKHYVKDLLRPQLVSSILNLEKGGVLVTDHTVEEVKSVVDNYELHRVVLRPINGSPSPIYFRLPIVDEEGTYMVGGNKYQLSKVRQDLPIRKISPIRVALSSSSGKFFVSRTSLKAYDRDGFLVDHIRKDYLGDLTHIKKIIPRRKRLNDKRGLPNTYYALASEFDKVITDEFTLVFNQEEIESTFDKVTRAKIRKEGYFPLGYVNKGKDVLVMDMNNTVINYSKGEKLGPIFEEVGIENKRLPKPFSVIKVVGKDIPFGVCMAYYLGLSNLISITKTKYELIDSNKRYQLGSDDLEIRFADYKLILKTDTEEKRLIFNGFHYYKDYLRTVNLTDLDAKDIYLNIISTRDASLYHLKELDVMEMLFIDPITEATLKEMGEPTEFKPLLFRANEMLVDYAHRDINDPVESRIRGYDRMIALTYRALVESVREYHMKGGHKGKINMDPYKVWNYITQDNTANTRTVLNPVLTAKEDEKVTLTGRDGISSGAVPKELRRYHKNDSGLFSEATVDSKDVAVTTYLTPYAKVKNTLGLVKNDTKEIEENPAKIFSTPVQLCPFSEFDD